ncbi:MAG: leucine-rich repeat domain-containing protein [Capnocytophaga sp.]|nr:leucine-rich repeat domain-containing protein [Capnocytophaga sp.]
MSKLRLFCGLMTAFILSTVSCNKSEDSPVQEVPATKELKLESTETQLSIKGTTTIKITDGNGEYTAKSSDETIAKASIKDNAVTIEAVKDGSATVTISDAKNQTATIAVSVWKSIALDKKEVQVIKGATAEVNILSGEGTYSVSSNNDATATASVSGNTITITAVESGEATITVTDSKSSQTETIKVVVELGFHLEKEAITLKVGETQTIAAKNGSEQYLVKADSETIALAEWQAGVKVTGATVGTTNVIVTDNKTKETLTLKVTVEASDLTLSTNAIEVDKNGGGTFQINKGSGKYTITSSNAAVATAEIRKDPTNYYYSVIITDHKVGTTTLTITDTETNKTATVSVTVKGTILALGKDNVTLEIGNTETINIFGNEDYTASSSAESIATAIIENKRVKITAVAAGSATITITDNGSSPAQTKTISVTVNAPVTNDNNFVVDENGVLTKVKNITAELVIPSNVKKISSNLFSGNKIIEKITMESVEEIEDFAFANSNVKEVILGDKIKILGTGAFRICRELESVTIKTATPPTLNGGAGVFRSSKATRKLIVPKGAAETYKADNNWKSSFSQGKNIEEAK